MPPLPPPPAPSAGPPPLYRLTYVGAPDRRAPSPVERRPAVRSTAGDGTPGLLATLGVTLAYEYFRAGVRFRTRSGLTVDLYIVERRRGGAAAGYVGGGPEGAPPPPPPPGTSADPVPLTERYTGGAGAATAAAAVAAGAPPPPSGGSLVFLVEVVTDKNVPAEELLAFMAHLSPYVTLKGGGGGGGTGRR